MRKLLIAILAMTVLAFFAFVGCDLLEPIEDTGTSTSEQSDQQTSTGTEIPETFTVSFVVDNEDYGSVDVATVQDVALNTAISVDGASVTIGETTVTATPADATAEYTYYFAGFEVTDATVTGDVTVTVKFTREVNGYTVTVSVNDEAFGSVDITTVEKVAYGTAITVDGATLTIGNTAITATPADATAQYTYAFEGFTYDETVMGDTAVTANFTRTENYYTVTVSANDGTFGSVDVATVENVAYGTAITVDGATLTIGNTAITATPADSTAQYTYAFEGFTYDATVTGDTAVTANFTRTVNNYTVTVTSDNTAYGTVSAASATVPYGTAITVDGATLTIGDTAIIATPADATAQYTYAFTGFTYDGQTVTGDAAVTANFTRTINSYTVSFKNYNGTVLQSETLEYGATPSYKGEIPVRETDENYSYEFAAWDNAISDVTGTAEYTATFTATELNVISVAEYSKTSIIGDLIEVPSASVVGKVTGTLVSDDVSATATFNGEPVTLTSNAYRPLATGSFVVTYSADGLDDVTATITVDNKVTLVDTTNLISKTTKVSGGGTIGSASGAQYGAESASCIKLPDNYSAYDLTFDINVGDVSGFMSLEMTFWALGLQGDTWTLTAGDKTLSIQGWRGWDNPVTISGISTSSVTGGKLRVTFTETWSTGDELYIRSIKGVVAPTFTGVPANALLGKEFDATATYMIGNNVIAEGLTATSVTFNGDAVTLPYTPVATGTLTLTYEYNGTSKSFDVAVVSEITLVDTTNLMSKTSFVSGKATFGNVSGAQIGAGSAYCIKLPADPDWSSATVTFDVEVGDVSAFTSLEIKFWALGISGDTWTIEVGDKSFSTAGWRSWDNPVTLSGISPSSVTNGKLRITFTQTWQVGDELYIQYIKGKVEYVTLVNTTNLISKTALVSGKATFGNVSGNQYGSESASCIKLPADPDWSTNTVTFDITVGDVSAYSSLEITFWALGLSSDTWTLVVGDKSVEIAGWRGYDNPVTISGISTSSVTGGKLRVTFTETWQVGDELYIREIKAIA